MTPCDWKFTGISKKYIVPIFSIENRPTNLKQIAYSLSTASFTYSSTLKIEAIRSSGTSVILYWTHSKVDGGGGGGFTDTDPKLCDLISLLLFSF
jgi:hypothetical protein